MKVITTLRFLATGKMQQYNSNDSGPSECIVNRAIRQNPVALYDASYYKKGLLIFFTIITHRILQKQAVFTEIASSFPVVAGVIDCTHIKNIYPTCG